MIRLTEVRKVRAMPDRVEIVTDGPETFIIHQGVRRVNILCNGLIRRRKQANTLATFLFFPDGPGAIALVEKRAEHYTLVLSETAGAASSTG